MDEWISVKERLPERSEYWKRYIVAVMRSHFPTSSYDLCDSSYDEEFVITMVYDSEQKIWHLDCDEQLNALIDIDAPAPAAEGGRMKPKYDCNLCLFPVEECTEYGVCQAETFDIAAEILENAMATPPAPPAAGMLHLRVCAATGTASIGRIFPTRKRGVESGRGRRVCCNVVERFSRTRKL